jgi:hypothetical protein
MSQAKIYTEEMLAELKKTQYGAYKRVMRNRGKEPEPRYDIPTMKTINTINQNFTEEEKNELNSMEACMLVSCRPSVKLLRRVVDRYPEINFNNTKKIIQEIEKRLHKRNLFRKQTAIVSLAIYLGNIKISQVQVSNIIHEFGGCSDITIINLGKLLGMFKKGRRN